jgi:hypothetical protein
MMKNKKNQASDTWLTPKDFYEKQNLRFNFDGFDPCPPNNDLNLFDGLKADWADRTYCNPPYSQKLKESFLYKGYQESLKGKLVVFLLPVSTSTKIYHELINPYATVEFLRGRLRFEGIDSDGNWVNPNTGMYKLDNVPEDAIKIHRSGQNDSMLVTFDGAGHLTRFLLHAPLTMLLPDRLSSPIAHSETCT